MVFQDYFYQLTDSLCSQLKSEEFLACWFSGEESDFVRVNENRIRQAGHVQQLELTLNLINGDRHASIECTLSSDIDHGFKCLESNLHTLRNELKVSEPDPYLHFNSVPQNRESTSSSRLLPSSNIIHEIITAADGLDLVGFYAGGTLYRGFANSLSQRNWFSKANFNFDWSCYLRADKAVKSRYAGFEWNTDVLDKKLAQIRGELHNLDIAPRKITPGKYRVYLTPAAVAEILTLLSWNSFGLKSHRTKQTPLIKLIEQAEGLDPCISLKEDNDNGLAPNFTPNGFMKPASVELINKGRYADCLVSARSGKEYGHSVNAGHEIPQSLAMDPGKLEVNNVLQALDTGIYINNLWYSNFSDRNDCRITGMTRFACFWVEHGQLRAPIEVMRFDESLYRMLGDNLVDLTQQRELIFDSDTYERRSVTSLNLPGLLIKDFTLTL